MLHATADLANGDADKKFDIEGGDRLTSRFFRCVIRTPNGTISRGDAEERGKWRTTCKRIIRTWDIG